jgi:uncharacterized protein (TIGR02246 family)
MPPLTPTVWPVTSATLPESDVLVMRTECYPTAFVPEAIVRAFVLTLVLTAALTGPAFAGPEEDALRVVEKWAAAFNASDVDTIVGLYAPDALFLGTGSRTVVRKTEEIRQYFERALLTDRPRGAVLQSREVMALSDGTVVITGLDETTAVRDGKTISNPGRVTFVVARRGADWKIVHFHRSTVPGRAN